MKKVIGTMALLLGSVAFLQPTAAFARDHDGDRGWRGRNEHARHEWREHERHEWREHERYRPSWGGGAYFAPSFGFGYATPGYYSAPYYNNYAPNYSNGYYDAYGYWHPYY